MPTNTSEHYSIYRYYLLQVGAKLPHILLPVRRSGRRGEVGGVPPQRRQALPPPLPQLQRPQQPHSRCRWHQSLHGQQSHSVPCSKQSNTTVLKARVNHYFWTLVLRVTIRMFNLMLRKLVETLPCMYLLVIAIDSSSLSAMQERLGCKMSYRPCQ